MERGNSTHGARQDEALTDDLRGELGPGGSNREDWAAAEPFDEGDPAAPGGPIAEPEAGPDDPGVGATDADPNADQDAEPTMTAPPEDRPDAHT